MTKLQLITELRESFTKKVRDDRTEYYTLKDHNNDTLVDLVRECHFDMLPNDTSYNLIVRVIDAIKETLEFSVEIDEECYLQDLDIESDIYNADLINWLASNLTRSTFVDDAMANYGCSDCFNALSTGQWLEMEAIKAIIIDYIENVERE
jgi:hypothetical protein